jgi:sodium transport system permease protein
LNLATVKTLFRVELRMVSRDRRMIVTSLVLPMLVMPLLFLGSTVGIKKHEKKLQEMVYPYAVTGPRADSVRKLLASTRERLDASAATNKTVFRYKEVGCRDPQAALNRGEVQLIIEAVPAADIRAESLTNGMAGSAAPAKMKGEADLEETEKAVAGAPVIRIVYRADRHESNSGSSRMRQALTESRRLERAGLLKEHGFPIPPIEVAAIAETDLASKSQVAGLALGKTLTFLLLLFILSSGAVVATDSLAGEKERGTLETLLTTGAGRLEILMAKHLVIVAVALLITSVQLLNVLAYIHFKLIPVPPNWAAAIKPLTAVLLFFLYIPMAALVANVLLLVSGYARSYKEAQMWFLPVLLLAFVPALAPLLPGVPLRSAMVLVPVANLALAAKEILIGSFDWPMIVLSWVITLGAAAWTARLGVRTLVQEKLITAADTDAVEFTGGPALFERRVLIWFGVLWAVLVMVNTYTDKLDIRLQVAINLLGLFFGACCLMMRIYRLDPRQALALRTPRPAVWLGLVFAVPGGLLSALGLFRLSNFLIPAPEKILESFNEQVLPTNISFIQVLLLMTVLPGIFEEVTFRGMLLHGLRRRLHPASLALVVGVVFGIFHVALFRFVPTAALGVMFAAVTLLTGSIFPAMVWHAASNALGLLAARYKLPESQLEPVFFMAGAGLLALAFWIFWRNRSPYPGLRLRCEKPAHSETPDSAETSPTAKTRRCEDNL